MDIKNIDLFFSENPNPMWIYDPSDLSIKEVNKSALELYGYSYEEMCSITIKDLRPKDELSGLKEHIARDENADFNNAGIWKHQKKNGEFLFVRVLTNPVSYEGNKYKVVVVQDVTGKLNYQQRYEMLFEHSLDGIMLTNPNGDILQANQAACDILGMTEEEIISRGREGIVVNDEKLTKALRERSATGGYSGELTYIHKSGRKIPVEITTSVFDSYIGENRTSLIFRDISNRKDTEKALREEKDFTDVVLDSLPGVFFVLDTEGKVVRWNNRSSDIFNLTPDEIEGKLATDFIHEDDKKQVFKEISRVLEEKRITFELTLDTSDETPVIYRFIAKTLEQDGQTYIVGTGIDVSEQKELEKRIHSLLQEEKAQRKEAEADRDILQAMFEEAPSPKCVLEGPEHRFVIANKSYRKVVGQEDIIGKRVIDVIPEVEEQGYIDILDEVYQTGEPFLGEEENIFIDKDNPEEKSNYIFNLLYAPLFDENDEVYAIFVEVVDLSDQISYQKRLEESLKEKETLLGEIHHRVKNNLAVVSGMMELQAMESKNPKLKSSLRTSQQRVQTIATIHELLYKSESLSHVSLGDNIKQLVSYAKDIYDDEDQISTNVNADSVVLNINQAIPCALIINEIVSNAFEHAFKDRNYGKISVSLKEDAGKIYIEVVDNGMGIPDKYFADGPSTIGMTLISLLKQQLKAEVDFSKNGGTCFSLHFEKADMKGAGSSI